MQAKHSSAHQYLRKTPAQLDAITSETRTLQGKNKINEIFPTSFGRK
ncbi:LOW QUALITY PROTEIN: uncharacterized protein Dyak_GE29232 [Drosophila yakuba]|uniref:Uncharacterized protein n=1 Tax=Drosophila yakuba TaxID=7245 RepID=A0A0R1E1N7_DROYA|nr:LOW QUALITY PROTEIN: uncharacterized protein Dyak_GE29232 [Drosophila yakuba]